jgi:hypothetical protein
MPHRILVFPVLLLVLGACNDGGSPATPSAPGAPSTSSHNAGRDCLQCHGFSVAGTVYRDDGATPYPGATVRLTSEASGAGEVLMSLTTDRSGSFYTNEPVSWGGGLYADVRGSGGTLRPMEAAVTGGACNSCHAGGNRIRAD